MGSISLKQARQRLGRLVEAAERGESTTITRRGRNAARVVPIEARGGRLPGLRAFRATIRLRGKPLSAAVTTAREADRY